MTIIKPFRPIRAADTPDPLTLLEQHLPLLGSWKLDGIRGTDRQNRAMSRTMIPLPSAYAQKFAIPEWDGVDGEFTPQVVPPGVTLMSASYSAVMTHGCVEPLYWNVFDLVCDGEPNLSYIRRYERLQEIMSYDDTGLGIIVLEQRLLSTMEEVLAMEQEAIDLRHEGLIVRRADAPYKFGKSTLNQGYLIKVARWLRSECELLDFEEQMQNNNAAVIDPRGLTKRAKLAENLVGKGTMGRARVRDIHTDVEFYIGTGEGLDFALRDDIWRNPEKYRHTIWRYKFKPYGVKDRPRHPVLEGPRHPMDIIIADPQEVVDAP